MLSLDLFIFSFLKCCSVMCCTLCTEYININTDIMYDLDLWPRDLTKLIVSSPDHSKYLFSNSNSFRGSGSIEFTKFPRLSLREIDLRPRSRLCVYKSVNAITTKDTFRLFHLFNSRNFEDANQFRAGDASIPYDKMSNMLGGTRRPTSTALFTLVLPQLPSK